MTRAVKKSISLPKDVAAQVEERAREEGKTVSGVIQEALREAQARRLWREFKKIQGYWSAKAREKGILTERDLERILRK